MKSRVFLIAALTVSAAFVFAQGGQGGAAGPGGQGGRQGVRGQGRGGFGQVGRGGFGQNELALAMRKDVQADIAVTDEQKKKLEEFSTKQREAMRSQFGNRRPGGQGGAVGSGGAAGGGAAGGASGAGDQGARRRQGGQGANVDRDAMRAQAEARRAELRKALGEILNEGQMKRLDEIALQLRGNSALMSPETQKSLNFTPDQTKKIQDLLQKQREANQSIQEKVRNQEISREEAQASREKNNKVLGDELAKILTPEQQTKFTAMQGKPFKADPNEGGRGGRGGGF